MRAVRKIALRQGAGALIVASLLKWSHVPPVSTLRLSDQHIHSGLPSASALIMQTVWQQSLHTEGAKCLIRFNNSFKAGYILKFEELKLSTILKKNISDIDAPRFPIP